MQKKKKPFSLICIFAIILLSRRRNFSQFYEVVNSSVSHDFNQPGALCTRGADKGCAKAHPACVDLKTTFSFELEEMLRVAATVARAPRFLSTAFGKRQAGPLARFISKIAHEPLYQWLSTRDFCQPALFASREFNGDDIFFKISYSLWL